MITATFAPRDIVIPTTGGLELRGWHWARPEPKGVLAIAHGLGEHGGCYRHVAESIGPALGIDIVAPDLRGHGRSPGRRGVVRRYEDLRNDVSATLEWSAAQRPGLPLFLLGHSNGGLLALWLASDPESSASVRLAGLIVSNPALAISAPVPRAKILLGRVLLALAPGVTLAGKLDASHMTRDPEMQLQHLTDPLRHSRVSAPLYFGMAGSGAKLVGDAQGVRLPLLMILGEADPVIDPTVSIQVFERFTSPDKTLKVYPEMRHEPLNELGREQVLADLEAWIRPRLK